MIRAVIFDFNGVLLDDEHVHFSLFREVLAPEGVALTQDLYHDKYLGYDDRGCLEAALLDAGKDASPNRVDALIARKAERYFEVAEEGLNFFPSAAECLAALSKRWPLAICSGALRPEIVFALKLLHATDQVAAIVSAEDTSRGKPDPEGYLLALAALRKVLPDLQADQCLVIEDSLAGIISAKGAGMHAVGVSNTYGVADLADAGAEFVLPGLVPMTPAWIDEHFA